MQLLGSLLRVPVDHPLRSVSFSAELWPATEKYVRRIGRPSKEWVPEVFKVARQIFGSLFQAQRNSIL